MELYKPEPTKFKDFTVGADIEYIVTGSGKPIHPKMLTFEVVNYGNTGWDGISGDSLIHEIRPRYAYNPLNITHNIRQIFSKQLEKFPKILDYTYQAGACHRINGKDTGIGAHLHYGFSKEIRNTMSNAHYDHITRILDNYVGICSILLEDREQGLKRRKIGYGLTGKDEFGESNEPWRKQPHGAEYRVCSSFLVSPHVTNAFTCLFKVIVFEYLNNPNFKFQERDYSNEFYRMDIEKLRNYFPGIWFDIQQMMLYSKFKCYIDLIYRLVSKKLGWTQKNLGLKEAWGFIKCGNSNNDYDNLSYKFKPVSMQKVWGNEIFIEDSIGNRKKIKLPTKLRKEEIEWNNAFKTDDGYVEKWEE